MIILLNAPGYFRNRKTDFECSYLDGFGRLSVEKDVGLKYRGLTNVCNDTTIVAETAHRKL